MIGGGLVRSPEVHIRCCTPCTGEELDYTYTESKTPTLLPTVTTYQVSAPGLRGTMRALYGGGLSLGGTGVWWRVRARLVVATAELSAGAAVVPVTRRSERA